MNKTIEKQEIDLLFEKFSHPIVKTAITPHQNEVALGIAKILWLFIVNGNDTEQNVYNILNQVFENNHEKNIGFGSLYFFKMKKALSNHEVRRIRKYYSVEKNLNELENWLDEAQTERKQE
jgi:hypothetical protein